MELFDREASEVHGRVQGSGLLIAQQQRQAGRSGCPGSGYYGTQRAVHGAKDLAAKRTQVFGGSGRPMVRRDERSVLKHENERLKDERVQYGQG